MVCVERSAGVLANYSPTCRDGTICSVLALLARGERRANTEVKTATAHVCVESHYIRPLVPRTVGRPDEQGLSLVSVKLGARGLLRPHKTKETLEILSPNFVSLQKS